MTPLLQHILKLPATSSLVKIEQRKGAQKIKEVYYLTEKVSPTEEVWEHEEVVEEHAKVLYEDELAPLGKTIVSLSEVDILSTTEKASQRDKKSELRREISVTDASKRKETRLIKHRVVPKTQETIVVIQESESDKDREVTTLQDKPTKEKNEEDIFVRTIESPTEEITDERKDSISVTHLPDKKDVSKQETSVTVKKGREITIKTESKGRQVREQEVRKTEETATVKQIELVKDAPLVTDADKTKPFPIIISKETRKLTEKLETEGKALTEVTYKESIDHDVEIISAVPEEKYSRTEDITEITIKPIEVIAKDKPTKVISTQVKMVDKETSRKEETQIKSPVISDSLELTRTGFTQDETRAPGKVSVKKHELTEKKQDKQDKPEEIIDTKKEKIAETPMVKPKESVTDIKLKKPKVIEQETEVESVAVKTEAAYRKKEESKDVPPQRDDTEKKKEETSLSIEDTVQRKPSILSKPEEKKRISPQTTSRGTEKKYKIMIIFL